MTSLHLKIVALLMLVVVVGGSFLYVNRLRSTIEFQKAALTSAKSIIEEQRTAINTLTEEKKDFDARLAEAQKKQVQIKSSVEKQATRAPAVPVDCKAKVQWLKKRAIELKQDGK